MRRLTATLFLVAVLLAAGPAIAVSDVEWQQIREEESRIVFRAPGLEEGIKRFYIGSGQCATRYLGRWVGPSGVSPTANIIVREPWPSCTFSFKDMESSLKEDLRDMKIPEGSRVFFGKEITTGNAMNALGRVTVLRYSVDSTDCVSFKQHWRSPFRGDLLGSYCVHAGETLSVDTIVKILQGIGVK